MNLAIILVSCILWFWFLGCTISWRIGKILLVEGTGTKAIEFKVLLLFTGTFLLYILFPSAVQWALLVELSLWLSVQFLCHWRYTLWGAAPQKIKGYNECFKGTLRLFPTSETRLVPDLYHIVLHILIAVDLILVVLEILKK